MLAHTLALILTGVAGPSGPTGASLAMAQSQDPPVSIRLDRNGEYDPGHDAQVTIQTELEGYLLVLHADPQGRLRVLFPLEPYDDAYVEGGREYALVNRGGRGAFFVSDVGGYGTVFAALSEWPFHVAGYAKDHRWDYERLWVSPDGDIEDGLVNLVAGMAYDGWFDYDLVEYEVYGAGAGSYAQASNAVYVEPYCCSSSVGVSILVGGDPYWPYYGPPYVYASYYRPYWYPYYYYGGYYVYRPRYRYPYYGGVYYGGRYRYAGGRDYRFKPPYRYDRDRRLGEDPYRRRGIGIDARRQPDRSPGVDYRGRRTTTPERRTGPASGGSRPRVTTASSGRRVSPAGPGARRAGPVTTAGAGAVPGRTESGGRRAAPSPRGTPSTGRPQSPARRPAPAGGGNAGSTFERLPRQTPTRIPRLDPGKHPTAQPPRRTAGSSTEARSSGRPVLRRQQPSATRPTRNTQPVLRGSRPAPRSAAPSRSTPRRTVTAPSRPSAASAGRSVSRRPAARAPSGKAPAKSTARRRPR